MTEVLINTLEQHGPWVALAGFLIWSQRKDYRGVCNRLNEVEDYCKDTITKLVEKTTIVIEQNTEIIAKCQRKNHDD